MHELEVDLHGLRFRGFRRPGSGPRCLAFHGWLDNAGTFLALSEALKDWDFLSIDLPGHGHSEWLPPGQTYHFIDSVAWACSLVEHFEPQILMGHSMGGAVACMAAAQVGEGLKGLALLDAVGPITTPAEEALSLFSKALASQKKPYRRRFFASPEEAIARVEASGHSAQAAAALTRRSLRYQGEGYYFSFDPRLKCVSPARLTELQIQAFLRGIPCPVQVQVYSRGILMDWPPLQARLDCLANNDYRLLEGGHHLHLEQSEMAAEPLREFWGKLCGK